MVHHCLSTKIKLAQWNSLQYFFGNFILRYVLFNLFIVETVSHAQPFYQCGSGIPEQAWHLALQGRVDFNILLKQCGNSCRLVDYVHVSCTEWVRTVVVMGNQY